MIVEHEVIEQIEEEPTGRSVEWLSDFVRGLGSDDPTTLLERMWRAGYLAVVDDSGRPLRDWQCEELWMGRAETGRPRLVATPLGSAWVHGSTTVDL